jgi:hypothetical protein
MLNGTEREDKISKFSVRQELNFIYQGLECNGSRRPGFNTRPVHVTFVLETCGIETGYSLSASFSIVGSFPPMLHTNIILKLLLSEGQAVEV